MRRIFSLDRLKFEPLVKLRIPISEDLARTEHVRAAISGLDPIDAQIVRGHFGIEAMPQSLDALGRQLGISKQAVKNREERALTRLGKMLRPILFEN